MIGTIISITKGKLNGMWAWACRKCGQEYSYLTNKCGCEKKN